MGGVNVGIYMECLGYGHPRISIEKNIFIVVPNLEQLIHTLEHFVRLVTSTKHKLRKSVDSRSKNSVNKATSTQISGASFVEVSLPSMQAL